MEPTSSRMVSVALVELIGDLYDCAVQPECWPATLERLTREFNGRSATVSLHDPVAKTVSLQLEWNLSKEFREAMEANMAVNPVVPCANYYDVDQPFSAFDFAGEEAMTAGRWSRNTIQAHGYGDAAFTILSKSSARFGCSGDHA